MIAIHIRYQQWIADIYPCNERPVTMTVDEYNILDSKGYNMEPFESAVQLAEVIIIKRDFDLMSELLLKSIPSPLNINLLPFTALLCYEGLVYLKNKNQDIFFEQTSKYSIEDVRLKAKFFDFRIQKLFESIKRIDKNQHESFIAEMKNPEYGRWNTHTNIGIFYNENKKIIFNTHFGFYVFQSDKELKQPLFNESGHHLSNEEVIAFGYDMGRILGSISSGLNIVADFVPGKVIKTNEQIHSQDYNTNRCNVPENYKIIRLFLLHVLSNVGFILFFLKTHIVVDTGLLLRVEYIAYHYLLQRLEETKKFCQSDDACLKDKDLLSVLDAIVHRESLINTDFRNCMMHLGLYDKNKQPLIKQDRFNLSLPFCGLVESLLDMSYEQFQNIIENELRIIYDCLHEYLNFEILMEDH